MKLRGQRSVTQAYAESLRKKLWLFAFLLCAVVCLSVFSLARGSFDVTPSKVIATLFGQTDGSERIVIWNIRMPRIIAAIVAGWCLGLSGAVMQCLAQEPACIAVYPWHKSGSGFWGSFRNCGAGSRGSGHRRGPGERRSNHERSGTDDYPEHLFRHHLRFPRRARRHSHHFGVGSTQENGPRIYYPRRCCPFIFVRLRHDPGPVFRHGGRDSFSCLLDVWRRKSFQLARDRSHDNGDSHCHRLFCVEEVGPERPFRRRRRCSEPWA